MKKTFGQKLRAHRIRLNSTLEQIAGRLGVSVGTVWNWETGKRWPKPKMQPPYLAILSPLKPGRNQRVRKLRATISKM